MRPIFITGTGTDVGKTIIAAIITEALHADYWKPVQAGYTDGTDSLSVAKMITNKKTIIHPELYKLKLPASPHISAREENKKISVKNIIKHLPKTSNTLIVEGAGGLMVPLNETLFVADLIKQLNAKVILVSRNYLGSINHSLLTAEVCRYYKLDVLGWIFNDQYLAYEEEIVHWSGCHKIAAIPFSPNPDTAFIREHALLIAAALKRIV